MLKTIILTTSILYSCILFASPKYQVDVILFTHPQSTSNFEQPSNSPLILLSQKSITLKTMSSKTTELFQLLPPSKSGLSNEYYLLNHKKQYQILGQYSWIQPMDNKNSVALPSLSNKQWNMLGLIKITHEAYFSLDAKIQLAAANNAAINVVQKQRMTEGVVYYLDHELLGMLVKIHRLG